jgi:hypothetical protein
MNGVVSGMWGGGEFKAGGGGAKRDSPKRA